MRDEDDFSKAQERLKGLSRRPTNEQLLAAYGLYKQATDGDVRGSRPGMLDLKGRAKFDAWARLKGIPQSEARTRYVDLVDELVSSIGSARS